MKHSQSLVEFGWEQGYLTFKQINGYLHPDVTPLCVLRITDLPRKSAIRHTHVPEALGVMTRFAR